MRIGRVAHPGGVAFVAVEAEPDGTEIAAEIAEHPFGTPNLTGRRWPLADVRVTGPDPPHEDRLHRPELPGPRRGVGQ